MKGDEDGKEKLHRLFVGALGLEGSERARYLEQQCGDNDTLKRKLAALLAAAERSDEELASRIGTARERLFRAVLSDAEQVAEDLSGQRFGSWRLDERIARGGLATVYRAHRDDGAFEQTVAFKVLRRGLDTDDVIDRFRAERQILFQLDHPAIARIYDGGAMPDGRPYLVLEYVDGQPITTHCEQHTVGLRERVRLVAEVLRALHQAHRHLVVHRDVKPSNILVSNDGRVALLDFGIAKLLAPDTLPGGSALTRTGVSLLTPGYGSPEQRKGEAVTTASDIYQAGLVLFELLSGERPFPVGAGPEADPPPLSQRLRNSPWQGAVRGDLDAIVQKALRQESAERYSSADEMAADLDRYLAGLPVTARPATFRYRMGKLARRRPWLLPAAGLAVLAVVVYVVTLTVYSTRLAREERLSAATLEFMVELFRSPDPFAPADPETGRNITVVEALAIGRERVRDELSDQPELKAALLAAISDVYGSLSQHRDAIELREEALALERKLHGDRSEEVLGSLQLLGGKYARIGEMEQADAAIAEQLDLARTMYGKNTIGVAEAELLAAEHARRKGEVETSMALLEAAMTKLRAQPDAEPTMLATALSMLALLLAMEDPALALEPLGEAVLISDETFGRDSLQAAIQRIELASALTQVGDYERSKQQFLEAIPVLEARSGPEHSDTLSALNNLGFLYHRSGSYQQAEEVHAEVLERQRSRWGGDSRDVADSYQNLARAIASQGRYDEALPLHREAYRVYRNVLNEDNYMIAFPLLSIAYSELERGDAAAAETAAREALQRFQATVAGTFLEGVARCLVGLSLERQGHEADGRELVESSHALLRTGSVPDPYPSLCRLPPD